MEIIDLSKNWFHTFYIHIWWTLNALSVHIIPRRTVALNITVSLTLLQGEFPVSLQECRAESTASSMAASLPSPPWTLPTRRPCPSRPRTCLYRPKSARPSLMSGAPSVSLWRSTCSSSPSCGSLSWMWALNRHLMIFFCICSVSFNAVVRLCVTVMFPCRSPAPSRTA